MEVYLLEGNRSKAPTRPKRRKAEFLRSSSGSSVDLDNWDSMLDQETGSRGVTSAWMTGSAWGWISEGDLKTMEEVSWADHRSGPETAANSRKNPYILRCVALSREFLASPQGEAAMGAEGYLPTAVSCDSDTRRTALGTILVGIHLFREEQKLSTINTESSYSKAGLLAPVLAQIGGWLGWESWDWKDHGYYGVEMASIDRWLFEESRISTLDLPEEPFPPPSILSFIEKSLNHEQVKFLTILDIVPSSASPARRDSAMQRAMRLTPRTLALSGFISELKPQTTIEERVELLFRWGLTSSVIDTLPDGISASLHEAIAQCQPAPPSHWGGSMFALIDRGDLLMSMTEDSASTPISRSPFIQSHDACVMKPSNVTISAEKSAFSEDKVCWAFFHNGASTGLALSKAAKGINTSWILYNKPTELTNRHAGFLLALGLNGHLKSLAKWVAFKYLTPKHTMTSIGLLLGLSASYLGTMDTLITRLLSVHVTRMLPPGAAELNLSPLTQTTGIMGIGLLYCNSQHRRMSEVMLSEMENTDHEEPSATQEILRDEGYRLASGFALGFINLGKGSDLRGLRDMHIVDRLLALAVGTKSVDVVHILDKATAGATVALAIIFMKSNDATVAERIDIPDTVAQFDYVRPDIFLLRTLAKNLIMWDSIVASDRWIKNNLPSIYKRKYRVTTFATAQDIIALSAAAVMAGTGDLIVFRRLRSLHGHVNADTPYGTLHGSTHGYRQLTTAPCLLPNIDDLATVKVQSPDHWDLTLDFADNPDLRDKFRLGDQSVYLRRRAVYTGSSTSEFSSSLMALSDVQDIPSSSSPGYSRAVNTTPNAAAPILYSQGKSSIQVRFPARHLWEWIFNLRTFRPLDMGDKALVIPSVPSQQPIEIYARDHSEIIIWPVSWLRPSAVDTRLVLEKTVQHLVDAATGQGDGDDTVRDRLWQLRLLFAWLDSNDDRTKVAAGETRCRKTFKGMWLRADIIEDVRWRVWGVQVGDNGNGGQLLEDNRGMPT
ncbi:predicted protein [Histoplasma mississippiense (nom. inval.)]|uniref:predicted protein n=1 Tax=Ajellomyces capsulatus (strain NAm1 / WU24) TaxID=2059318 RepID=UPI000157B716|nr:predicted protein [Histoplasma mississippiense (nom. inval.)]EDN03409.1 predicted protein [Histoplasma mississippiense (nom. inval.)]